MLKLKKTAVAVLALGSSAVFAGTMGPVCAPGNVTVPCERSAWDVGAQALYLQPAASGVYYDGAIEDAVAQSEQYFHDGGHAHPWNWGFMIEGSYHFSTGNDLNINWYHWNQSYGSDLPINFETPFATLVSNNSLSKNFRWDAANFEFGQHVDFGEARYIRFHGGVQYARLNLQHGLKSDDIFDSVLFDSSGRSVFAETQTYNGFGPRGGVDMMYGFGNGLSVYGKGAAALLVGPQGFNASASFDFVDFDDILYMSGSLTAVVPELEAKLGAAYTYSMAQGDISIDAGWMWVNYFNAVHRAPFDGDGKTEATNFAVQGPYVGLNWVGNVG